MTDSIKNIHKEYESNDTPKKDTLFILYDQKDSYIRDFIYELDKDLPECIPIEDEIEYTPELRKLKKKKSVFSNFETIKERVETEITHNGTAPYEKNLEEKIETWPEKSVSNKKKKIPANTPLNIETYIKQTQKCYHMKDYNLARKRINKALAIDPNHKVANKFLNIINQSQELYDREQGIYNINLEKEFKQKKQRKLKKKLTGKKRIFRKLSKAPVIKEIPVIRNLFKRWGK